MARKSFESKYSCLTLLFARKLCAVAVFCCALLFPRSVLCQYNLSLNTESIHLGQFSAIDIAQSNLYPGELVVTLNSPDAWDLIVTLQQPIARIPDGLELPVSRALQLFPDLPPDFANYSPVRFDYGPGAEGLQEFSHEWLLLQQRIELFLEESDPPGLYQTRLEFALHQRDGQRLAPPVQLTAEFEILPWVQMSLPNDPLQCLVSDGGGIPSDPYPVHVRSNSAWELSLTCLSDLSDVEESRIIPMSQLYWLLWAGYDWESYVQTFEQVTPSQFRAAFAPAPQPFSVFDAEIPLQIQVEAAGIQYSGIYTTDLAFDIFVSAGAR